MSKFKFTQPISDVYPSPQQIDEILQSFLPQGDNEIVQAIKYSLLGGGKRIRFKMALAFGEFFDVLDSDCERLAVAVEMIHAYSLIHDDLPCMDNDDFRRGKPSCHKAFGEYIALLAGNGLLTLAASILTENKNTHSHNRFVKGGNCILDCAGVEGMLLGQVYDIQNKIDAKTISYYKTAKLFVAAVMSVGLYAKTDQKTLDNLNCFAENFGIGFQLADDIADNQFHGWASDISVAKTLLFEYSSKCSKALDALGYTKGFALNVLKYFDI